LLELVRRILDETPLARLRLSSIEPQDVTQDLVELVVRNDRLARHFHIPLQSASDRILAKMHRWYRAAHYARKVELIRDLIPAAAIGADVIAGFPGETDADHRATVDFVASLPFSYLHVFSFSKRPGTAAEELCTAGLQAGTPLEVPPLVIKQRSRELRALGEKKKSAFRAAQVGSMLRVLTLGRQGHGPADCSPGLQTRGFSKHAADIPAAEEAGYNAQYSGAWTAAISDNYLQLRVPGHHPRNRFLDVRVGANHNEILSPACGLAAD
jgi:threonylcarbamoyladenosine tRNA methylthiotransferase MtaB